jgi:hypothetical protein
MNNFSADLWLGKPGLVMAHHGNPHVPGIVPRASWRYGPFENLSRRKCADDFPRPHYSVRREKALCVSQVQVLSGELSGHPSSYQDGQKGN